MMLRLRNYKNGMCIRNMRSKNRKRLCSKDFSVLKRRLNILRRISPIWKKCSVNMEFLEKTPNQ